MLRVVVVKVTLRSASLNAHLRGLFPCFRANNGLLLDFLEHCDFPSLFLFEVWIHLEELVVNLQGIRLLLVHRSVAPTVLPDYVLRLVHNVTSLLDADIDYWAPSTT